MVAYDPDEHDRYRAPGNSQPDVFHTDDDCLAGKMIDKKVAPKGDEDLEPCGLCVDGDEMNGNKNASGIESCPADREQRGSMNGTHNDSASNVNYVEATVTFAPRNGHDLDRLVDQGITDRSREILDEGETSTAIQFEGRVRLLDSGYVAIPNLHAVFSPSVIHNIQPTEDYRV